MVADGTCRLQLSINFTVGCDDLGAPYLTIDTRYPVGEHIVLPRNAISNVFSGAHGAPLRLGKAQMSYIRCDDSAHPTVKCVDKCNSQVPCMVT